MHDPIALSTPPRFHAQWLLSKNPVAYCKQLARQYGDFVHARGFLDFYLVNHEALLGSVMVNRTGRLERIHPDNPIYERIANVGRSGLATSPEAHWKTQRRLLAPLFTASAIRGFADTMVATGDQWVERWHERARSGRRFDLKSEMNQLSLDVNTRCLFNTDLREDHVRLERWFSAMKDYLEAFPYPVVSEWWFPSRLNLRTRRALRSFDRYARQLIEERRAAGAGNSTQDLVSRMMAATDPQTGRAMSEAEICHEMLTFLIAGYESTSSALLWSFIHLAREPEVERQLLAELDSVLAGRMPTHADLHKLKYTRRVVDEVMRITPSVWFMARSTSTETDLGGHTLPAGSHLLVCIPAVHHNPRHFPNPEKFDPDRFLPEAVARRSPNVYMPFGRGPHACIGTHFSLQELVLMLAQLASRFRVELDKPGLDMEDVRAGLSVYPRQRVWARIVPRREAPRSMPLSQGDTHGGVHVH